MYIKYRCVIRSLFTVTLSKRNDMMMATFVAQDFGRQNAAMNECSCRRSSSIIHTHTRDEIRRQQQQPQFRADRPGQFLDFQQFQQLLSPLSLIQLPTLT